MDIVPGVLAAVGLLAAVRHAERTGEGQLVDVAMYDAVLALCERIVHQHSITGRSPVPQGNTHRCSARTGVVACRDGFVTLAAPSDHHWRTLAGILGRPESAPTRAGPRTTSGWPGPTRCTGSSRPGPGPCRWPRSSRCSAGRPDPLRRSRLRGRHQRRPACAGPRDARRPAAPRRVDRHRRRHAREVHRYADGAAAARALLGEHTAEVLRDGRAPWAARRDRGDRRPRGRPSPARRRRDPALRRPGGGANLDLVAAAAALGVDFVLAHGESAACVMASVHGRLTGTVGAAVVTRGPGADERRQRARAGRPRPLPARRAERHRARGTRRTDGAPAARPARRDGPRDPLERVLGAGRPYDDVRAAVALAQGPPAGAVHLCVDASVAASGSAPGRGGARRRGRRRRGHRRAGPGRRPVVVVGLDAAHLGTRLREVLDRVGCPVLTTYQAKGAVAESSPGFAGLFTGARLEAALLERADLVVGVGLDPVEPVPGPWPYPADVVLSTAPGRDRVLRRPRPAAHGHLAGPPAAAGHADEHWPAGTGARVRAENEAALDAPARGLRPHDVVRAVRAAVGDVPVTVDAGAHMLVAMELWRTDRPGGVPSRTAWPPWAFALPAAIGAALARPGERVVCLVGDGGLGMVLAELETVARLDLDVAVVVLNDATLTLIELKQPPGAGSGAVAYRCTDFAAVAAATGLASGVATDAAGVGALLTATPRGPLLVDARVDRTAYRHVPTPSAGPRRGDPCPGPDGAPSLPVRAVAGGCRAASTGGVLPAAPEVPPMTSSFPPIAHVAVTVTDLARSAQWYARLFGSDPVLDEDETTGGFHHTVFLLDGGTSSACTRTRRGRPTTPSTPSGPGSTTWPSRARTGPRWSARRPARRARDRARRRRRRALRVGRLLHRPGRDRAGVLRAAVLTGRPSLSAARTGGARRR